MVTASPSFSPSSFRASAGRTIRPPRPTRVRVRVPIADMTTSMCQRFTYCHNRVIVSSDGNNCLQFVDSRQFQPREQLAPLGRPGEDRLEQVHRALMLAECLREAGDRVPERLLVARMEAVGA